MTQTTATLSIAQDILDTATFFYNEIVAADVRHEKEVEYAKLTAFKAHCLIDSLSDYITRSEKTLSILSSAKRRLQNAIAMAENKFNFKNAA